MSGGIPLGPYRLVRRLATGGMAEIFLARREGEGGFSRELVVKRVLPNLALAPEFRRMFQAEARLAALLSHPNIVHVYDYGSVTEPDGESTLYLAMELVRGVDLRALVVRAAEDARQEGRREALAPPHAAKIASYVCEALAYAHDLEVDGAPAKLVHRDVTPSNVLLSFDGAVKLADFGIAKSLLDAGEATAHGVVKGKCHYLSPEQARGEVLDRRSDVFNVGILLFESILGEPLFSEPDRSLTKRMAARGEIPDRMRIRRLPPRLADVAERALCARAVDRYPDALAMREDLEGFVRKSGEPTGSVEIGRLVRASFPQTIAEDRRGVRAAGTIAQADVPRIVPAAPTVVPPAAEPSEDGGEERGLVASGTIWLGREPLDATRPLAPRAPQADAAVAPEVLLPRVADAGALVSDEATVRVAPPPRVVPRLAIAIASLVGVVLLGGAVIAWRGAHAVVHLRVTTRPASASIRVDGELRGPSPLELELEPRSEPHHVEILLDGYDPIDDEVLLAEPGANTVLSYGLRAATPR